MDNSDPALVVRSVDLEPSQEHRPPQQQPEEHPPAFALSLSCRGRSTHYERAPHGGQDDLGHVLAATGAARSIFERWWAVVTVDVEVEGGRFRFRVLAALPKPDAVLDDLCDEVVRALEGYAEADSVGLEWETP